MKFWRQIGVIAVKDLRAELRSKEVLNAAFSFALVILLLFNFAFAEWADQIHDVAGGLVWIVWAFAGVLILNRSFARELANDCLDALIAAPIPCAALFLGKALANFILVLAIELVSLLFFGIFYNVRWAQQLWPLMLVMVLATWGLTVVGVMFSALTVNLRLRELMLPMLIYPIMIPALLGAMEITNALIAGKPLEGDLLTWLRLLVGFDVIFTALAVALIDTVLVG